MLYRLVRSPSSAPIPWYWMAGYLLLALIVLAALLFPDAGKERDGIDPGLGDAEPLPPTASATAPPAVRMTAPVASAAGTAAGTATTANTTTRTAATTTPPSTTVDGGWSDLMGGPDVVVYP